ncbi:hypothetical protein SAMN02910357_00326 [Succinivibrio dextrinosolvens]|uniref:hypothetical protein n=1 Tax=Succinivibrio dextrinosolvens TaxID=83771 RepID=UPI0008E57B01|nr:hypothetical protein [Succinivibrio dextrinosolvens]SFS36211.1 hypothetical protein SAMN02910357_00326 [Succinivibrio dextrinosolvens]
MNSSSCFFLRFFMQLMLVFTSFFTVLDVEAEQITVKAIGKDSNTAYLNAQVNAVRSVMLEMIEPQFQKSHVKELREIIATVDKYSDKAQILSETNQNKNVHVEAKVEVNRGALEAKLKELGAKIVKSYKALLAERTEYAQSVLNAVFGEGGKLSVKSTPYAELSTVEPVSEEIDDNVISGPAGKNEFLPEEDFVASYYKDEDHQNKDYLLLVVRADLPVGSYEEGNKERLTNSSYIPLTDKNGLVMVKAPLNPGSYELRMYNGKDTSSECKARWGFKVKKTELNSFMVDRDVFAPEEKIWVHFDSFAGVENYQLRLIKSGDDKLRAEDIRSLSYTSRLGENSKASLNLKAPKEEGNYEIIMISDGCKGYCKNTENHRRSFALSHIPIRVKSPKIAESAMLLIPAEIRSGATLETFFSWPSDTEYKTVLRLYRADDPINDPKAKPIREDSLGKQASVVYHDFFDLYEPGDYRVDLYERDKNSLLLSKEFRVLPNVLNKKPSLETNSNEFFASENCRISYTAASDWNEHAFIALVPKDTVNDAKKTYESAKSEHRFYLNHRFSENDRIMSLELPEGAYELRMYDREDEHGTLKAKKSVTILSDKDEEKRKKEIDDILDLSLGQKTLYNSRCSFVLNTDPSILQQSELASSSYPTYDRLWWYADEERPSYKLISEYSREEREAFFGTPKFIKVANFKDACDISIDKKLNEITRMDITLGRDSTLEKELVEFGKSMVLEWPHGFDKLQTAAKIANDTFEHGTAGLDAISEGEYTEAAKQAGLYMVKTLLNSCGDDDCYFSIVGKTEDSAKAYFGSLSDEDFLKSVNRITKAANTHPNKEKYYVLWAQARGRLQKLRESHQQAGELLSNLHDLADNGLAVYEAATGAEADDGAKGFITVDNGVVKTDKVGSIALGVAEAICRASAKCAMLVSSGKLAYQSALATRDFCRDSSVLSAYSNWQKFEGTSEEWLVKAGGVRGLGKVGQSSLLAQAKNIMVKTARTNKMTASLLSEDNKHLLGAYKKCLELANYKKCEQNSLKESDISDDEAWTYLYKQFEKWDEAENGKGKMAEYARKQKSEFQNMDKRCRADLEFYVKNRQEKKGTKDRIIETVTSWFTSEPCEDEGALFEAYFNLKSNIENEYKNILPPVGQNCWWRNKKDLNNEVVETLCNSLREWNYNYHYERKKEDHRNLVAELDKNSMQKAMETIADRGCECGVPLSVVDGKLYPSGMEPADRMKAISDKVKKEMEYQKNLPEMKKAQIEKIKNYTNDYNIGHVMSHIGRREVLNCLCMRGPGAPAFGGGSSYAGGGKCNSVGVSGWGSWKSAISTKESDKRACGYYSALDNYLDKKASEEALNPMLTSEKDIQEKILTEDPFIQLRKKDQCKIKR